MSGFDVPHQRRGAEPAHAEGNQRPGKKIAGDLFRLVRPILHILDKVAPGADLRADI